MSILTATEIVSQISKQNRIPEEWFFAEEKELLLESIPDDFLYLSGLAAHQAMQGKRVFVHGDYDVDGIVSARLIASSLRWHGVETIVYLPNKADGYGFSQASIQAIEQTRPDLILAVDCGTNDIQLWESLARKYRIIILDHHINTLRASHPNVLVVNSCDSGLQCSAGALAYWFGSATGAPMDEHLAEAALSTLADVMPLDRIESFAIARAGLKAMQRNIPPWFVRLAGNSYPHSHALLYSVAPRLNSVARMQQPTEIALRALENDETAFRQISLIYKDRVQKTRELKEKAMSIVKNVNGFIFVLFNEQDADGMGMASILAAQLASEANAPAIVGFQKDGVCTFSARDTSPNGYDFHSLFGDITSGGGHTGVFGFRVQASDVEKVLARLQERGYQKSISVSAHKTPVIFLPQFSIKQIQQALIASLLTEPHGKANEWPVFGIKNESIFVRALPANMYIKNASRETIERFRVYPASRLDNNNIFIEETH